MNNLTKLLFTSLLISVLLSCKNKVLEKSDVKHVNILANQLDYLNTSSLIKNIKFIPLETLEEAIIGEISKIIKTEKEYLVLDSQVKKLFAFDINGKYLRTIGSNGQGPGEYLNPIDFCIDPNGEYIIILDQLKKIIKTDFNGNLLLERFLPENSRFFDEIFSSNGFVFASTARVFSNCEVIQFTEDLNTVQNLVPCKNPLQFHYPYKNKFFTINNDLFFISVFDYTIYKYDKNDFQPYYSLDFSGFELDPSKLAKDEMPLDKKTNALLFDRCVVGNDLIYLPVFIEGKPTYGFFQPNLNKYSLLKEVRNDSYEFLDVTSYFNGKFISSIGSFSFKDVFPHEKIIINPSGNPVIIEYELSINSN
jgi:hypothetical protein